MALPATRIRCVNNLGHVLASLRLEHHGSHVVRADTIAVQLLVVGIDDGVLLALGRTAITVNAVEEDPVSTSVNVDVARVVDVLENSHAALGIVRSTPAKVGIAVQQGAGPWQRCQETRVVSLPVRRLALLEAQEDVLRLVDVDLVQRVVLTTDTQHPGTPDRFNKETTSRRGVSTVVIVEIVIGAPAPAVLPV